MPLDENRGRLVREYRAYLDKLTPEARADFVDAARRNEDWPDKAFLVSHANKWGEGKRADAYADWAYLIKNRPGVRVYAYIHPVHLNRGLAFVDMDEGWIVQFDADLNQNFECFRPPKGIRPWVADKEALGTHWRLKETER
jgi:hypothetical protein